MIGKNFIVTSDEASKDKLLFLGFKLINEDKKVYTFENDLSLYDNNILKSLDIKYKQSNILTF